MTTLKTPIAFIMFNRPDCANRTFTEMRKVRPEKLYLIADGPRAHKEGEAEECAETRRIVENMIDWPCDVHKDYAEQNMGCGKRIISGLNWVFENEEQAIILEDDILAHSSFFGFCETLLRRYSQVDQIMQISGYNPFYYRANESNYFYSQYAGIWGWATWRRAWDAINSLDSSVWNRIKQENRMPDLCLSFREAKIRTLTLDRIFSGKQNTWGAQWGFAKNIKQGFGVVPSYNLTKNIGFSVKSTHTINPFNRNRFARIESITPPFIAPENIQPDAKYDSLYNKRMYSRYISLRTAIWNLVYSRR